MCTNPSEQTRERNRSVSCWASGPADGFPTHPHGQWNSAAGCKVKIFPHYQESVWLLEGSLPRVIQNFKQTVYSLCRCEPAGPGPCRATPAAGIGVRLFCAVKIGFNQRFPRYLHTPLQCRSVAKTPKFGGTFMQSTKIEQQESIFY
ncbi:hypothetical protein SDC9_134022 [bioreactor metagenome]|uniref:Uncharacterized protein n=1 Tax=bioreactor metagenome TaxID=1076179 RepID=A0A645DCH7_9ZZZZ